MKIQLKRIYADAAETDGYRVLIDRVWPRGISKEKSQIDKWIKELAPSTELRKWFDHKEERFTEFSKKYQEELQQQTELIDDLLQQAKNRALTLVYSAKDEVHNQAVVLKDYLEHLQD